MGLSISSSAGVSVSTGPAGPSSLPAIPSGGGGVDLSAFSLPGIGPEHLVTTAANIGSIVFLVGATVALLRKFFRWAYG